LVKKTPTHGAGRFVRVSHHHHTFKLKLTETWCVVCLSFKYKRAAMGFVREKEEHTRRKTKYM
jgi:hypothetical protein